MQATILNRRVSQWKICEMCQLLMSTAGQLSTEVKVTDTSLHAPAAGTLRARPALDYEKLSLHPPACSAAIFTPSMSVSA